MHAQGGVFIFLRHFQMHTMQRFMALNLSTASLLTNPFKWVSFLLLKKVNKPVVPSRGVSPMVSSKGIITLTLVVSRERKPSAIRGFYVMFKFFKVKTKLETQIEEYIQFKAQSSPFIAEDQQKVLLSFIKHLPYKTASEITLEDINAFHLKVKGETTSFKAIKSMQALRAFMRFEKKQITIKPSQITNEGIKINEIKQLQSVEKSAIIPQMKRPKIGRPYADVELIKKIKRLKDKEGVPFRKIGIVVGKDVSHVYKMYRYNLTNSKENVV